MFSSNTHPPHHSREGKFSKIGSIPLEIQHFCWDSVQFERGKFRIFVDGQKFSPFHCKTKIPVHVKFSAQIPTLHIFQVKESFRKSVEYLWRYSTFCWDSVQVWCGKFLQFVEGQKFSPCYWKTKIPAHLKLSAQVPTLHIFPLKESFPKIGWLPLEI